MRHNVSLWFLLLLSCFTPALSMAGGVVCGQSTAPCAHTPSQGSVLLNTQTTGAAVTPVTVTLAAVQFSRTRVFSLEARCNTAAATADLLISDGGTTIWSSGPLAVTAAQPQYRKEWATGYTGATNSQILVTLSACTAGTGTLIVQADRW